MYKGTISKKDMSDEGDMKNYLFTFEKSIPKYKQIYTNIKLLIEKGVLKKMKRYLQYVSLQIHFMLVEIQHY